MRRLVLAAGILLLFCCANTAQESVPSTVDLNFLGVPGEIALKKLAADAKLKLVVHEEALELDRPVWISAKRVTPTRAAELLSLSTGKTITVSGSELWVRHYDARVKTSVKGYDVSVLTGRYVEYVNQYGRAEVVREDGKKAEKWTAAQALNEIIESAAQTQWGSHLTGSVVGDRILYSTTPEMHARIRELLDLLMAEAGGESADLSAERAHVDAMARKGDTSYDERPLGSVIANLCAEAGVGFIIDPYHANDCTEQHMTWSASGSYLEQLRSVVELGLSGGGHVAGIWGLVYVRRDGYYPFGSVRVFDVGELLRKLDDAYARQRTKPGRAEGFDEGLSSAGGVSVISDALDWQLFEANLTDRCHVYGTKIIVGGGPITTDTAAGILKEMGWEE